MERITKLALGLLVAVSLQNMAQAQSRRSLAGEESAEAAKKALTAEEYNIEAGPVRLRSEANLAVELNDNVYRSESSEREDIILRPEVRIDALWPVTDLNALTLSLGLGYDFYLDNSDLNSDAPLVSPDTEIAWNIFTGDFRIKLRNRFSYEETLYIGSISVEQPEFINFSDVGKYKRLSNLTGGSVDWDLNDLIISFSYDHEYYNAMTDRFEYLDRQSELFAVAATFLPAERLSPGIEVIGSLNDYDEELILHDHWRIRTGPFVETRLSDAFRFRIGAGYDTAEFSGASASDYDTYYAYGRLTHLLNRFLTHSLSAGRVTEIGYNGDNYRSTFVRHSANWNVIQHVEINTRLSANFAKEFGAGFYEEFTAFHAGLNVAWQFHKHWRAVVDYGFLKKDSETLFRDFTQNVLTLAAVYEF